MYVPFICSFIMIGKTQESSNKKRLKNPLADITTCALCSTAKDSANLSLLTETTKFTDGLRLGLKLRRLWLTIWGVNPT